MPPVTVLVKPLGRVKVPSALFEHTKPSNISLAWLVDIVAPIVCVEAALTAVAGLATLGSSIVALGLVNAQTHARNENEAAVFKCTVIVPLYVPVTGAVHMDNSRLFDASQS